MMKIKYLLIAILITFFALPAKAEVEINVSGAQRKAMKVAMPEMLGSNSNFLTKIVGGSYGDKVREVVIADLERSGLFEIIPERSYIEKIPSLDYRPSFVDWQAIKAQALVQSRIQELPGNKLKVDFRLWDAVTEQELTGKTFTSTKENWRRLAHVVADAIYERLTGDKGYFNTRVVYVSESGMVTRRVKRLAIMDQDGENHRFLTDGRNLVLTPRFSPNMQRITYLEYAGVNPRVYMMDLNTNSRQVLGNFPGMTFAPVFSPDGNKVLMSYANNGATDIYEMNLNSRSIKQITHEKGSISTSPSYSPDGSKIVFNSDRGGNQQLYVMNADGSNSHRLSPDTQKSETDAVWLNNETIAFVCGGEIWSMHADGSNRRKLSDTDGNVEGFKFSPDRKKVIILKSIPYHEIIKENPSDLPKATGRLVTNLMYRHWDHYVESILHPFVCSVGKDFTVAKNAVDILEGEPYECPMEPFGGIEQLDWSVDSRQIAYTCRKKVGLAYSISTDSDIYLYDVESKTTRNLCKPND